MKMINYRNKKAYLEKIRAMIIELIEMRLTETDRKYCVWGHIKKNQVNYGFKQKYFAAYSRKFYLPQSMLVIKADYDLIVGREALESEIEKRNYRTGYNINVLKAFDEILLELTIKQGYQTNISKNASTDEIYELYKYLSSLVANHSKQG